MTGEQAVPKRLCRCAPERTERRASVARATQRLQRLPCHQPLRTSATQDSLCVASNPPLNSRTRMTTAQ